MASVKLSVNTSVFLWAMNRNDIVHSEMLRNYPNYDKWISGDVLPTVAQLKAFSKKFHFPFGYFLIDSIPNENQEMPFFRSNDYNDAVSNLNVKSTVKTLKTRQEWISDYFMQNDVDKIDVIGSCDVNYTAPAVKNVSLFLELSEAWNLNFKTPNELLKKITEFVEDKNIFVTYNSVVGNNTHRQISVESCRGFCLVDEYAPFIFINSADSKKAQVFTLMHELVHIFISYSSGYGYMSDDEIEDNNERFCNKVAAEILVPEHLLRAKWNNSINDNVFLSDLFKVSEVVILRRELDCGLISKSLFLKEYNKLRNNYHKSNRSSSGGNFDYAAQKRIGKKFLVCLDNAVRNGDLSPTKAYALSGLKGDIFHRIINGYRK